jgi:regulator of protease activity HflC (stomatin/prohibitin superfamily)
MVTVRAVIGEFTLEYLMSKRLELNDRIKEVCSEQASTWGVEIDEITLLGVTLRRSSRSAWRPWRSRSVTRRPP